MYENDEDSDSPEWYLAEAPDDSDEEYFDPFDDSDVDWDRYRTDDTW